MCTVHEYMARYAHRGHHGAHDENTLVAFRRAVQNGMGFECDVRMSRDGVPVVIHDKTLWRTHGTRRRVADLLASELDDAGVPTVTDVLDEFGATPIIFDVKEAACIPELTRLCRRSKDKIFLYWSEEWSLAPELRWFRARGVRFPSTIGRDGIACKFNGSPINIGCIERALEAGMEVNLFPSSGRHTKRLMRLYGQVKHCTITL